MRATVNAWTHKRQTTGSTRQFPRCSSSSRHAWRLAVASVGVPFDQIVVILIDQGVQGAKHAWRLVVAFVGMSFDQTYAILIDAY